MTRTKICAGVFIRNMEGECFLCNESDPPLSRFCKCRNMPAHKECMLKTISSVSSHRESCPVCDAKYMIEPQRFTQLRFHCHYILLFDVMTVTFLILIAYNVGWRSEAQWDHERLMFYAVMTMMSACASVDIRCTHGRLFPFSMVTRKRLNILSRPTSPGDTDDHGKTSSVV